MVDRRITPPSMDAPKIKSALINENAAFFATCVFAAHFLYLFLIQIQNAAANGAGLLPVAGHQFDTIAASALVAAAYLGSRRIPGKAVFFILFTSLLAIYATSAIYFRIFRQPFALSDVEGFNLVEAPLYWGSFVAELGPASYLNYALALVIGLTLYRLDSRKREIVMLARHQRVSVAGTVLIALSLVFCSVLTELDSKAQAVTRYPLLTFIQSKSANAGPGLHSPIDAMTPERYYQLEHGVASASQEEKETLAKDIAILRSRKRNVVFIVLESVGSRQLLENGVPRKDVAPFLHSQLDRAIIFDNLPTVFPGSTRSHVALTTGGRTLTWGSVYTTLPYQYAGQTLVSAFRDAGRPTALYSAGGLNFENLNMFYANLGYDMRFDADTLPEADRRAEETHSWGVDERYVADKALDWAKSVQKPFFLTYLNVITHHPYGAPSDYASPFPGGDNLSKYNSAIHFTDSVIGKMVDDLKATGLADDTMLFIVGDHGEAFGDIHDGNYLHKGNLYEENIRDFLMIVDLAGEIEPLQTSIASSVADVMPTILDTQSIAPANDVVGQSLFSPDYTERMAFFQKNSEPEKWGLRDGKWKFIIGKVGSQDPELFDLEADPNEQVNLAAQYPERIPGYVNRISNWYVQTNDGFVERLKGFEYEGNRGLTLAEIAEPGPKRIAIGRKRNHVAFEPLAGPVNPEEDIVVWTHGPAYPDTRDIRYVFTSPSQQKNAVMFRYSKEWSEAWLHEDRTGPREEGDWQVELFDGDKSIMETRFTVSADAPLYRSFLDMTPGIREISVGVKKEDDDFHILQAFNPQENVAVLVQGVPFAEDRRLDFLWIAPDDSFESFYFMQKAGWDSSWVFRTPTGPMTPGTWRVEIWMDGQFQIGKDFAVTADAPVFLPIADSVTGNRTNM